MHPLMQPRAQASIHPRRKLQWLARPELFANQRQPQKPALKLVGKAREKRRLLLVLEEIELADDEVALFARADELGKARGMMAAMVPGSRGLRVHAGHE